MSASVGGKPKLDGEIVESVTQFYFCPDIIYTMPGMADEMTVWENGKKTKLRKYFLTMFLREAFQIFTKANPKFETKFKKFCSLRPKNVLLLKHTPSDQCKCQIHENMFLRFQALGIDHKDFMKKLHVTQVQTRFVG